MLKADEGESILFRRPHIVIANMLLDQIRTDIEKTKESIAGRYSKSSDLEELVFLLKCDNNEKKQQIERLKRDLSSLKDSNFILQSSVEIEADEKIKQVEREKKVLQDQIIHSEFENVQLTTKLREIEGINRDVNARCAEFERLLRAATMRLREKVDECSAMQVKMQETESFCQSLEVIPVQLNLVCSYTQHSTNLFAVT